MKENSLEIGVGYKIPKKIWGFKGDLDLHYRTSLSGASEGSDLSSRRWGISANLGWGYNSSKKVKAKTKKLPKKAKK